MKKLLAVVIGATYSATALFSVTGFASENYIDISGIEKNGNIISIEAINSLPDDTFVTLTVTKDDEGMAESDRVYTYAQEKVEAGKSVTFSLIIPETKNGVSSAGKYIAVVQNMNREKDEEIFYYADSATIAEFIEDFKTAAESVTDPDKAYEALMPLMSAENAGAIFGLGIDYNVFAAESESVRNDTLNLLCEAGVEDLDIDTAADAFTAAFGLAIYNDGDKGGGIEIYSPVYGGEKMSSSDFDAAADKMEDKYDSIDDFRRELSIAYGLVQIDKAKVGTVGEALADFASETGECRDVINKIANLSAVKKKTACEYIVREVNSSTDSVSELESILESAYKNAAASSPNTGGGSGSGSGGGASGSGSNRVQSGGTSVSTAVGSGTPDEKVEDVYIFTDITSDHWAAEAVGSLRDREIINGTDTGAFEPDRAVTREEFTKMLVAACGIDAEGYTADFEDIAKDAWYVSYIGAAVDNNIVKGIGDNKFGVGANITRQDMAVMTERALAAKAAVLDVIKEYTPFADEELIADYAIESVKILYKSGVISGKGDNLFDPLGNATRAEAAKIIYEAFKGGV